MIEVWYLVALVCVAASNGERECVTHVPPVTYSTLAACETARDAKQIDNPEPRRVAGFVRCEKVLIER